MKTKQYEVCMKSSSYFIKIKIAKSNKLKSYLLSLFFISIVGSAIAGNGDSKPKVEDSLSEQQLKKDDFYQYVNHDSPTQKDPKKDDFYQYINGDWLATGDGPSGVASIKFMVQACVEKTKNQDSNIVKLYKSFLNTEDLALKKSKDAVTKQMNDIDTKLKDDISNLPEVVASLNTINVNPIMSIEVKPKAKSAGATDVTNTAILIPVAAEPSGDFSTHVKAVYAFAGFTLPKENELNEIFKTQYVLQELKKNDKSGTSRAYTLVELSDKLKKEQPQNKINYNFKAYWDNVSKTPPAQFNIINYTFFSLLNNALVEPGALQEYKSYFKFKILQNYAWYLNATKRRQNVDGAIKVVLDMLNDDVYKICMLNSDGFSRPIDEEKRVISISNNIINAYRSLIDNSQMNDITKGKLNDKLTSITFKVGFPEVAELEDYSGLNLSADNIVQNLMLINASKYSNKIAKIDKPVCARDLAGKIIEINATHCKIGGLITIPLTFLQKPFLQETNEDSYAGIGFIIAHEVGHALDDATLWTKEDLNIFTNAHKKLVDQYPGLKNVREPWADNLGMIASYKAYRTSLSARGETKEEEVDNIIDFYKDFVEIIGREFGTSGADTQYPPINDRINNILKNQDDFIKAVGAETTNKMYLPAKDRFKIF